MAQSSSVAREPSMEEILASIRRIIEESDTTRTEAGVPMPVNSDVPVPAGAIQAPLHAYDASEEEAELPPREGIAVSHPLPHAYEAPLGRPFSPLQSKLVEREAVVTPPEPQPEVLKAPVAPEPVIDEPADYAVPEPEAFAAPEPMIEIQTPVVPVPPQVPVVEREAQAEALDPAPELEPVAPAPEASEAAIGDEVSLDLERALEPILSEATERQVSAAFNDLSFAVQHEQRRSFDDIAQEIMRPLLQDWLDNNLPNLVERLVREEIERVARGAKR